MNYMYSTLMTVGLLMVGAVFSNVNAQDVAKALDLTDPSSYDAADLNKYYYIGLGDKSNYLTLDKVTNEDDTDESTVVGKEYYSLKGVAKASLADEGDKALFKITVGQGGTTGYFTLTSKTGKTVQFKAGTNPDETSTTVIAADDNAADFKIYFS